MIHSQKGHKSGDPKLIAFHNTRNNAKTIICIKDNPPMHGFGKSLKKGDKIEIKGTVHNHLGFCVCVPSECAMYAYNYFDFERK